MEASYTQLFPTCPEIFSNHPAAFLKCIRKRKNECIRLESVREKGRKQKWVKMEETACNQHLALFRNTALSNLFSLSGPSLQQHGFKESFLMKTYTSWSSGCKWNQQGQWAISISRIRKSGWSAGMMQSTAKSDRGMDPNSRSCQHGNREDVRPYLWAEKT